MGRKKVNIDDFKGEVVVIHISTIKKRFFGKKFKMYIACLEILNDITRDLLFRYIDENLYENLTRIAKDYRSITVKFLFVGEIFKNSPKEYVKTYPYAFEMLINNKKISKTKGKQLLNSVGLDWQFD